MRRLITDFRGGDLSGRCRYPLRSEYVPQISQIYTDFFIGVFCHADFADDADFFIHRMTRNLFGGIPAEAINHGFSRRRPIRSVQIPTESGKSPTDFTDIHRFFWGRFFLVTQISQMTQIFYSSDDTEFIRRFPAEAITHGFSQRRPIRSVQIPTESGICPTDIHRFFIRSFFVTQISQIYTDFYSSDYTEFIRRFPAETINHGFSRRRPIRSVQIPTESGQRDSTEIPLKICVYL